MIKPGRVHSNKLPKRIVEFTTRYGGTNLYGDPLFRIVWSGDRMEWKTARFIDKDAHGNVVRSIYDSRYIRKYRSSKESERWIIERWRPAEFFGTPGEWFARRLIMDDNAIVTPKGGYPTRGDYQKVDVVTLPDESGNLVYLEPTEAYIAYIIDATNALVNRTEQENEEEVTASNKKQNDDAIENLVLKMKEKSRIFYGPTVGYGQSASMKPDTQKPIWTEADVPYLRGRVGHAFRDEWALQMPQHYLNY